MKKRLDVIGRALAQITRPPPAQIVMSGHLTARPSGRGYVFEGDGLVGKKLRRAGVFQVRGEEGRSILPSSLSRGPTGDACYAVVTVQFIPPWRDMRRDEVSRWMSRTRAVDRQTIEVDTLKWSRGELKNCDGAGFSIFVIILGHPRVISKTIDEASRARGR